MADLECTGIAAQWCPNCGTCNCPEDPRGGRTRDRETCPLHGVESRHAETLCAGNCGEIVSEEGARCDACEMKHLRAERDALLAIVDGRTTPPTDAEIEAHAEVGGEWVVREYTIAGMFSAFSLDGCVSAKRHASVPSSGRRWRRWWPVDRGGIPCAWPTVAKVTP